MRRCELYGVSRKVARQRFHDFMQERSSRQRLPFRARRSLFRMFRSRYLATSWVAMMRSALSRQCLPATTAACGDYGSPRAPRGRQDNRCGGLRGATPRRLSRHLVDQGADRIQLCADLAGLGVRLKWISPVLKKEEPAVTAVMERLRNEGTGILLIYDNAPNPEALRPYLPRGGAVRVLVTSQCARLARPRGPGPNRALVQKRWS